MTNITRLLRNRAVNELSRKKFSQYLEMAICTKCPLVDYKKMARSDMCIGALYEYCDNFAKFRCEHYIMIANITDATLSTET